MNCIGALRRCSLTFAALVRSCGSGLVVDCALIAHGAGWREGNWPVYFGYIRRLDHSECVHLRQQRAQRLGRTDCARGSIGVATTLIVFIHTVVQPPCSPIARYSVSSKRARSVFFDPTICSEACSSVILVVLLLLPADSLKAP